MTKFNVGDKVRVIAQDHTFFKEGHVFTVARVDGVGDVYDKEEICVLKSRVELFVEETKPTKNQRITALENEVAELKLIVHELRDRPQLTTIINNSQEPSTTDTVEDIIEFEGKQYRMVDRLAKVGDVVIFRKNNTETYRSTVNKPYKVTGLLPSNNVEFVGDSGNDYNVYANCHNRTPETVDVYELIKAKPLTPNQQRAEIIEKAKKFVQHVIERGENEQAPIVDEGHNFYKNHYFNVDLHVKNNKVTALVFLTNHKGKRLENKPDLIGRALCSPTDVFNEHIGKAIALGRALNLDVSEFEQAVQPTIAIGQIINKHWNYEVLTLENKDGNLKIVDSDGFANGGDLPNVDWYTIINDTNAKY